MIRLQKLLAGAGLGSRRTIEEWIRAGRLTIGGRLARLGDRARASDEVCLDGRRLELPYGAPAAAELLLYYKPVGEVTTRSDPQRRPTVFERLPRPAAGRWISVGRLDVNTSGLLLLTTDGELAHHLMHPSSEVQREYRVRLRGRPGPQVIRQLLQGVLLEDGPARFDRITGVSTEEDGAGGTHSTFEVVLHEGRNREVRRLWNAVGFEVSRLLRVRYGVVDLPRDLKPGRARLADRSLTERLSESVRGARPAAARGPDPAGRPGRAPPPSGGAPGGPKPRRPARKPPPRRRPPSK